MTRVLVTSLSFSKYSIGEEPGDILRSAGITVDVNQKGTKYTEDELQAMIETYDGVVAGSDPFTGEVIRRGKNLKIIAKNGVGIDNIDVPTATERHIFVTITRGAVKETVADSTFALMLALARNVVTGDKQIRQGKWPRLVGTEIWNKRLGIVGLGSIGKCVAERARGFHMEIVAYDPFPDETFCEEHQINLVDFDTVFRECDIVTIHAPLNDATRHMVDARALGLMKPTAFLINAARGALVDEQALYQTLRDKKIGGAAIDCFSEEPPPKDSPLFELDNTVLTPHTAGYSHEALVKAGVMVAESVVAALKGEIPPNVVNNEWIARHQNGPSESDGAPSEWPFRE
jgi:D-3-phosphoglycerate dehydrogenase